MIWVKGGIIKNKIIILALLVSSVLFSYLQWNTREEEPLINVIGATKDILQGEQITKDHLDVIAIHPRNNLDSYSTNTEDFIGKKSKTDIPKGAMLSTHYFFDREVDVVPEGKALTAIRLLPDSAICWMTKPDSLVDVYFVDSKGEVEVLGKVRLIHVYDQNMSADDMLFYAVVEGSEAIVSKIVQKRTMGRLELVLTHQGE